MDIISRIEIKHFRSFDGGKDQPKVKIDDLKDLNVFSGANDSGKSNVLRALNLFFNNEVSPGVSFDKDRDFSKIVANRFDNDIEARKIEELARVNTIIESGGNEKPRDLRRSDEVISIKIFFNNRQRQRGLPEYFWISKSYSKKNSFTGEYNYQEDLNKAQTTAFLNSFIFEYVPAIKDRLYFNHLFGRLQEYLFEKGGKSKKNKFSKSSEDFNDILRSETDKLFTKFLESSGVHASFYIPSTLIDFFRTLSVRTENDISLFNRGDGVQARFIPEILDEISGDSKRNVIWGFEEPENSYEAKNIRKIKDEFQFKYSRPYQIFLTTHTKEFLALKRVLTGKEEEVFANKTFNTVQKRKNALSKLRAQNVSSDVSIYRVWKKDDTTSLITRFNESNNTWNDLCDDLGIIQEARIIDELQTKIDEQLSDIQGSQLNAKQQDKILKQINSDFENCLEKLQTAESRIEEYQKPILKVEDTHDAIYKIAYLKVKGIEFTKDNLEQIFSENCPFAIRRAEGAGPLQGFLSMQNTDDFVDKKVIGLFDYDEEGSRCFYMLKGANGNWGIEIKGDKRNGFYKSRKDHPCFHALLLPIPERLNNITTDISGGTFHSFVEIENLISEEALKNLNCVTEKEILTTRYSKIKDNIKAKAIDKFTDLPALDFLDFEALFNKIEELFSL